jgi:hypothetical protein
MGHRRQLERIIEAAFTCLIAGALTFCTFVGVSAAQSQRQQLIAAAKMNCHTTRAQLEETQLPNLRRRHTAFDTLLIDWKEKMPPQHRQNIPIQLQDGLKFEIAALQLLVLSYDALEHVIRACEALTEQVGPEMIAPLADSASQLNSGLQELRERWKQQPQRKAEFKAALDTAVELMIRYNASKSPSYIAMKADLDPDTFDEVIAHQVTLLATVRNGLNLLK